MNQPSISDILEEEDIEMINGDLLSALELPKVIPEESIQELRRNPYADK